MKKPILLFAALAVLCASAAFAMPGDTTVYHDVTPAEYFGMISGDADAISGLTIGVMATVGDIALMEPMHWVEGSDSLLGTYTSANSLASDVYAVYFSNNSGDMNVGGTDVYKPENTALIGLPNGHQGDAFCDLFIVNNGEVPVYLNGSLVFAPATPFDFDAWEATDFEAGWDEVGYPSTSWIRSDQSTNMYVVDSAWADMDPIEVDTSDPSSGPVSPDPGTGEYYTAAEYTETYTDYVLQPGEYLHWVLNGGSYWYYEGETTRGNFLSLGGNLVVTRYEPQPTEIPEPSAFAYGALGLVSALGMKRRIRK